MLLDLRYRIMTASQLHTNGPQSHQQVTVRDVSRADGVGNALRAAFRGRLKQTPPELAELLEKLN